MLSVRTIREFCAWIPCMSAMLRFFGAKCLILHCAWWSTCIHTQKVQVLHQIHSKVLVGWLVHYICTDSDAVRLCNHVKWFFLVVVGVKRLSNLETYQLFVTMFHLCSHKHNTTFIFGPEIVHHPDKRADCVVFWSVAAICVMHTNYLRSNVILGHVFSQHGLFIDSGDDQPLNCAAHVFWLA